MKIAGRTDTLFSADAVTLIHNASRGYPRAINNLAVNALTSAFASNKRIVDESSARAAATRSTAEETTTNLKMNTTPRTPNPADTVGGACSRRRLRARRSMDAIVHIRAHGQHTGQ